MHLILPCHFLLMIGLKVVVLLSWYANLLIAFPIVEYLEKSNMVHFSLIFAKLDKPANVVAGFESNYHHKNDKSVIKKLVVTLNDSNDNSFCPDFYCNLNLDINFSLCLFLIELIVLDCY